MKVYVVTVQNNACNAGQEIVSVFKVFKEESNAKECVETGNAKVESCYSSTYEYEEFICE